MRGMGESFGSKNLLEGVVDVDEEGDHAEVSFA